MRFIEPNMLIPTGNADCSPFMRVTCSNSSALPPPGCFITRSVISHSSRFAETGLLDANELARGVELFYEFVESIGHVISKERRI